MKVQQLFNSEKSSLIVVLACVFTVGTLKSPFKRNFRFHKIFPVCHLLHFFVSLLVAENLRP